MMSFLLSRFTARPKRGAVSRRVRTSWQCCTRLVHDRKASTAVEMSLIAVPLFALLIGALQLGIFFLSQSSLEIATAKAARTVLIGSAQTSGLTQQQFLTAVCAQLPAILTCANLMLDVQVSTSFSASNTSAPTLTYGTNGKVSNQWSYNTGGPNDIVVFRMLYLLPVISMPMGLNIANTLNGNRLLMATAVFKNEPYQ